MQHWKRIGIKINSALSNSRFTSLVSSRHRSTVQPESITETSIKVPRTSLPTNEHTFEHVGMWYTTDQETHNRLFHYYGFSRKMKIILQIFRETSFMIREPALSIIDYIKRSNISHSLNKYVLFGRVGAGKTSSFLHVVHHLSEEGFLIFQVSNPRLWSHRFREIVPSANREGYFDHTQDAAQWLQHFRQQNAALLTDPNLVTSETYQWTVRETTESGSPIAALVDFGIARPRFASETIFHLTSELKKHARERRVKIAVAIDGLNALFCPTSRYLLEDKTCVSCSKFTIFEACQNLLHNDWSNGVIVGTVDSTMSNVDRIKSILPRYLLGKKGWEMLEPIVPIKVDAYSDREFESAMAYYIDRMWLQHPAGRTREGKEELSFLSANNPGDLIHMINAL